MKTAVIYLYSKKLFQHSVSFFLKFSVASLLLLTTALGFGNLLFRFESAPSSGTVSADEKITVVIDPGHGGRDGGAVADDGTLEKDLNLAVALKLKSILESADIHVVMTRETDVELASPDSSHKKADDLPSALKGECTDLIHADILGHEGGTPNQCSQQEKQSAFDLF